jgi:hypothetical protein
MMGIAARAPSCELLFELPRAQDHQRERKYNKCNTDDNVENSKKIEAAKSLPKCGVRVPGYLALSWLTPAVASCNCFLNELDVSNGIGGQNGHREPKRTSTEELQEFISKIFH